MDEREIREYRILLVDTRLIVNAAPSSPEDKKARTDHAATILIPPMQLGFGRFAMAYGLISNTDFFEQGIEAEDEEEWPENPPVSSFGVQEQEGIDGFI